MDWTGFAFFINATLGFHHNGIGIWSIHVFILDTPTHRNFTFRFFHVIIKKIALIKRRYGYGNTKKQGWQTKKRNRREAIMEIVYKKTMDLIPYVNNTRTHSDKQVNQIASSIKEFGFTNPILIDAQGGHNRRAWQVNGC